MSGTVPNILYVISNSHKNTTKLTVDKKAENQRKFF